MSAKVGRVDHPVVAVHQLALAREQYKKLGFVVPPSGRHLEWGTENVCIMFAQDYLEIRGVGDPNKFLAGLDKFLVHGEGLSGVAFNAKSAIESYEAGRACGLGIEAPRHLNRKLVLQDRTLDLHFETVLLSHDLYPGLTHANLCQHLTPGELRQPGWLDHPNGAMGFAKLVGVVSDFDAAESAYNRLLGSENVRAEADRLWLAFGEGAQVELISPQEAERRGDAQPTRGESYIASATIKVKDVEVTSRLFDANAIRYRRIEDSLAVEASYACGAHLYFKRV
jgi:hypothetical protein